MHLKRIEIANFRGVQRLSLSFDELTVLIGENAWGKSSLLDALDLFLSPHLDHYQCRQKDFFVDHTHKQTAASTLYIVMVWQEDYLEERLIHRYRAFRSYWQTNNEQYQALYFSLSAHQKEGKVVTHYAMLDNQGNELICLDIKRLLAQFRVLHPLVRIRDARRLRNLDLSEDLTSPFSNGNGNGKEQNPIQQRLTKRLNNTTRRLLTQPGHVNAGELKSSIHALQSLVEHYFAFAPHNRAHKRGRHIRQDNHSPLSMLNQRHLNKSQKLLLISLLNAFIRARGAVALKRLSRPLLVLEDPEGRLHPTLLHQAWAFFAPLPIQKIITTNSAELLGATPLDAIRRLQRAQNKTRVFAIESDLLSDDELRRVTFHVRYHRPNAFFARVWLLVEGETEIWLFSELAKLLGFDLASEGIQLIDFAQSGLKSLLKTANKLGIEWHLVTDGDPAGKKYAQTGLRFLNGLAEKQRVTILPNQDMEHYLYHQGYAPLFHELANVSQQTPMTERRVISKALKHHAKPDVALAIMKYTEERANTEIPVLLKQILIRVIALSRGQS
ncbi:DUF2813 domain-containing protein [Thaumasiovibrio subtropicus]|uniref:DUF2813 domain-containing protein n=1 Tax=Thaumasiovibrio subtropicus TaxID=1891207 RepID=UPI000B34FF0F|nr:DUF2813 domain-containing protein [Thaumasiovibrio subtropicus]